ncbi:MAG TPA: SLC13 family permease [Thermodesulfovibrio thiophilus]|nr:SLC13 family permease [Thermodesulfovibrio thiophilus]HQD37080.1 SLC13 family permease [Thermodesulfovibrio thiophilus]
MNLKCINKISNYKNLIGWTVSTTVLIIFCFIPVGLPELDARIFGIILFVVVMWIFEPIPPFASTLLIMPFMYFAGVPVTDILGGFSSPTWVAVIGIFMFGLAIQVSGIGHRLSLLLLSHISATYSSLILGFLLVGLVLTFIIPSSVAKSVILLPIALSIGKEMEKQKNGPAKAGLTLSAMFGGWTTAGLLPTGSVANIIILGVLTRSMPQYNHYTSYAGWFILIGAISILATLITWQIIIHMFKPRNKVISKDVILKELKALPPTLTEKEKRILILAVIAILLWATSSWTKIPLWVSCIFVASLMASPGIGILSSADIKKLDWPTIIWMGGILTIASLMSKYAIAKWITDILIPIIYPVTGNLYLLSLVVTVLFFLLAIVIVNPYILAAVLLPSLVSLSNNIGVNPTLFVALFLLLFRYFIFPYQCQPAVIVYGMTKGEGFTLKQLTKVALVQTITAIPVALFSVFYWSIIGIL